jgi:hypothetical protein
MRKGEDTERKLGVALRTSVDRPHLSDLCDLVFFSVTSVAKLFGVTGSAPRGEDEAQW